MMEFLLAGGWSTWMVLILGGTCFAIAALFARRPETRRLPLGSVSGAPCQSAMSP